MTPDGTPVMGPTPIENLFLNTGDGTLGWTMACGSGRVLSDIIGGRRPKIDGRDLGPDRYPRAPRGSRSARQPRDIQRLGDQAALSEVSTPPSFIREGGLGEGWCRCDITFARKSTQRLGVWLAGAVPPEATIFGARGQNVDEATYVIFAAKAARSGVRERLRAAIDDAVRWTERKSFGGSEFFISGPPARAREAHEAMMLWMLKGRFERR
jgi:hypothetical protein